MDAASEGKSLNDMQKMLDCKTAEEIIEMAKLAKNPEAAKELLRCLDGKTVDEIIELSKNLD